MFDFHAVAFYEGNTRFNLAAYDRSAHKSRSGNINILTAFSLPRFLPGKMLHCAYFWPLQTCPLESSFIVEWIITKGIMFLYWILWKSWKKSERIFLFSHLWESLRRPNRNKRKPATAISIFEGKYPIILEYKTYLKAVEIELDRRNSVRVWNLSDRNFRGFIFW